MSEKVKVKITRNVSVLPAIALRGLVVFPNNIVHFEVGRAKSIAAIEAAMHTNSSIFLVAQKEMDVEEPQMRDLYAYGVIAEIKQVLRVSDDLVKVLVEGKTRARLLELNDGDFLQASVRPVPVRGIGADKRTQTEALVRSLKDYFEEYLSYSPQISKDVVYNIVSSDSPLFLSEYMPANLLLKYEDKQTILNESSLLGRLEKLLMLLRQECQVLEIERDLDDKVNASLDKGQREYYLREQMHIISEELGDSEDTRAEADTYRQKVLALKLDEESNEKLLKECDRLARMQSNSAESGVIRSYLDTCLGLPWHVTTEDDLDQAHARKVLDREHYGLQKVKERILELLAVRKLNTEVKGQIVCLVGPPGVGKTSIAHSIADCMGRKFARMSLGGVHDEAEIRGHRRTYIGAMPGRIISAINSAKSSNPVILLDEIDKLAGDYKGDPSSALLEVLDPEQNRTFKDNYLDIPFDLSEVLFITTANDASTIPGPLYDRMDVIELPSYTRTEKFNIAKRHLLPKQLKNNGLDGKVSMTSGALYEIIDGYTREAGVRNLERTITSVLRKCAQKIAAGETEKISVSGTMVKSLLGPEKVKPTFISRADSVGIANGLAWTSVGGEMLPVEVAVIPNGTGKIEITGSLGDVMKESAQLAVTYARVHAEEYGIAPDRFKNTDLHIHAPEGAVPKDGPSAGVTLTTALVSALSGIPVRHDLAMTGEITLHGNVLPIGGLKEKSMAAFREGISTVLIPKENATDLYEVDAEVKEKIHFIPVERLSQVLKHALIMPGHAAARSTHAMPQATNLIAGEKPAAKDPATVM
ncbi:MAG: endopeptidase La [Gemmiger sp.]|uniref:endopeptidase La n=1 Tax=Gemmiger sp. TaxID=2049027 RepID=UPI002A91E4DA|nr:endopeptidase La [Gemmiger sp.]MCI6142853.1 endopeptidase La [Subdoligranulum variabile]MCI6385556.1 endopeptidase La [Subdoligranulum variabile]MDD6425634.1 endopeptidase La [Subdoligranulum variabile]MDY5202773.1 endopeptidase La [Gemmiger sp.]MDY5411481.1 endopeptidase La [Gemmiger sp.]